MHWIGWRVSARWQPERAPAAVWWVTLPIWAALAILFHRAAPVAAYLFAWPLLLAGILVILCRRSTLGMAVASAIVLVASLALWARNTWILLHFMVPLFGWLPVTAPVWVYPALMAVAALVIAPPAIALVWERFSRALVSRPAGTRDRRGDARGRCARVGLACVHRASPADAHRAVRAGRRIEARVVGSRRQRTVAGSRRARARRRKVATIRGRAPGDRVGRASWGAVHVSYGVGATSRGVAGGRGLAKPLAPPTARRAWT